MGFKFSPAADIPSEIWMRILDWATTHDDGSTALSVSQVSKAFYALVQPYRFRTVKIVGWRSLRAFEGEFHSDRVAPGGRAIENLYIKIPPIHRDVYVPIVSAEDGDDDDLTYVDEETTDDGEGDTDEDGEPDDLASDEADGDGSSVSSTDSDYEYRLVDESEWDNGSEPIDQASLDAYLASAPRHGDGSFEDLARVPTRIAQAELQVYTAIRRILVSSSHSLRFILMSLATDNYISLTALFPVLPKLEIFLFSRFTLGKFRSFKPVIDKDQGVKPSPFPRLRRGLRFDQFDVDRYPDEASTLDLESSFYESSSAWEDGIHGRL
ncbi:hypothetical protein CC1G_06693 [Coprinopsis cinerea okayama7|uniref:F-box domain-containing protein n=1 Tax=Coprinopsis cinerea (strain Okayama-7 / 130 / ATCC MYA-4618 / FGSC 9003) TaxID=240176 RepID=A8P818_COPC7|nr:hypothetical protein CC1G_06693 [Coprinopsis cinerea okayama7\|eukprot:XP_001839480.1 hypothetical protein CC1G_06693 [Coprinopsis cinerea okayama7\